MTHDWVIGFITVLPSVLGWLWAGWTWHVLDIRAWLSGHRPVARTEHEALAVRVVELEAEAARLVQVIREARSEAIESDHAVMESTRAAHQRIDAMQ